MYNISKGVPLRSRVFLSSKYGNLTTGFHGYQFTSCKRKPCHASFPSETHLTVSPRLCSAGANQVTPYVCSLWTYKIQFQEQLRAALYSFTCVNFHMGKHTCALRYEIVLFLPPQDPPCQCILKVTNMSTQVSLTAMKCNSTDLLES